MIRPVWLAASVVLALTGWASARPAVAPAEMRGLWVLRTSLTSDERIRTMVHAAQAAGFNALMVQVRGRGEALYRSTIEPRASELDGQPPDFDPLAVTLEVAHQAGLQVHAWINVNLVASGTTLPRSPDHVVSRHPDWLMIPRDLAPTALRTDVHSPSYLGQLMRWTRAAGDRVEGLYLSPITPGAQDYTAHVIHDLVAHYALDGLHLDYARYPNDTFDYGAAALAAFRASRLSATSVADRQRLDQRSAEDPLIWTKMFPEGWITFRRDRLTALVSRVALDARATRPGLVVSAAVAPSGLEARVDRLQDWPLWAATGTIDVVCPMAYATDLTDFSAEIAEARASAGPAPVWVGIGAYRLPVAEASEQLRVARKAGIAGVVVFCYDSLAATESAGRGYLTELRAALVEPPHGLDRRLIVRPRE